MLVKDRPLVSSLQPTAYSLGTAYLDFWRYLKECKEGAKPQGNRRARNRAIIVPPTSTFKMEHWRGRDNNRGCSGSTCRARMSAVNLALRQPASTPNPRFVHRASHHLHPDFSTSLAIKDPGCNEIPSTVRGLELTPQCDAGDSDTAILPSELVSTRA